MGNFYPSKNFKLKKILASVRRYLQNLIAGKERVSRIHKEDSNSVMK